MTNPVPPLSADDPIDLLSEAACVTAPEYFSRVRELDPVAWSERHKAWIIAGHRELDEAFRDRRLSTERMGAFRSRLPERRAAALSAAIDLLEGWMLFQEPPTHTRLRGPLNRSFTPKAVSTMGDRVADLVEAQLDVAAADAAANGGVTDIVETFAHPLPAAVIAELFGVPADQRDWLPDWASKFGLVVFGAVGRDDYEQAAKEAGEDLGRELGNLMDRYRNEPEDNLLSLRLQREGRVRLGYWPQARSEADRGLARRCTSPTARCFDHRSAGQSTPPSGLATRSDSGSAATPAGAPPSPIQYRIGVPVESYNVA